MEIRIATGNDIVPWLDEVAALRIEVFREWPYLYDGDAAYERQYLQAYARSRESVLVLALDEGRAVGASTGLPLADETDAFKYPVLAAGLNPARVFYFGESVLLPHWRGHGIGHRFFDERERHARALGRFDWTAFCAVVRSLDDPRRPPGHRSLEPFWRHRGYAQRHGMTAQLEWREIGEERSSPKSLAFWMRPLE
jgi:GNAT superfamily N-acetyltransferase